MQNIHKIIIGSAIIIAILGGIYLNRPSIKVTAEATANATSTVIVPTSTASETVSETVSRETSTTPDVPPSTVYIYKTYVTSDRQTVTEQKPITIEPVTVEPINYVPTPVYSSPTVQPVTAGSMIETVPTPEPVIEPVVEPTVEPVKPTFTEWPHAWVEERYNGDWLFFEGKWDTGELGVVKCNGIYYDKAVKSGFASIIEAQFKDLPAGTYITCDFTVGDMGGTTLNYVTK